MEIFVSSVLKVKGAIIASAEVDEQGRYTPAGLMTLMATETILEDLVGYDEGYTYGLAVNGIANSGDANKAFGPEFSGTIGKHDYKQYVRATIFGTNVDLGNRSGALNTNLEQIVTIEGNGMKPVNFYIPTASEEQLKGAFKRINEFTLKERVIDPVKRFGERIGEAFTSATESIVKFLTPESPVSEKQDEGEGEIEQDKKEKQKPEQCAKKTNYFETYDDEDEIEDAEELEELEALREMIAEWDYEDSIKAAKARIAQEKASKGNWFSNLFISNAEASDGSKPKEEEGWISKESKKYFSKKLVEYLAKPEAEKHGLELIMAIIGYDLHMVGAGISEVEKEFPKLGKAVDKITEILNKPFEIVGEKISNGYSAAKEGLISEIGERYGSAKADEVRDYIAFKERAVGQELYKFAPDEKQERTLKYMEVIGVGKLLKEMSLFGVKKLEGLIENTSFSKLSSTYLKENWYQSTFTDLESTVKYHTIKHGKGRSPEEYTKSAVKFFSENRSQATEVVLRDGTEGLKIKVKQKDLNGKVKYVGGYFTKDGKIVTFFD